MRWLCSLLIALLAGCGRTPPPPEDVSVTRQQIPPAAVRAVQAKFPAFQFGPSYRLENGTYQIRVIGKQGQTHEVEVTAAGQLIEIE